MCLPRSITKTKSLIMGVCHRKSSQNINQLKPIYGIKLTASSMEYRRKYSWIRTNKIQLWAEWVWGTRKYSKQCYINCWGKLLVKIEFPGVQDRAYFPIEFPVPILKKKQWRKVHHTLNFRKFDNNCQEGYRTVIYSAAVYISNEHT